MNFDGRTVAMTGAPGGLGRALAAAFRRKGAKLALFGQRQDVITEMAAQLGGKDTVIGLQANVRDLRSLETAITQAADHFGGIDVIVANAGIGNAFGPLPTTSEEDWMRVIDINLNGTWRTFRAAAPHIERSKGHMLAIASLASFVHTPFHGSYGASKAAIWAMCNSLRLEYRRTGVTVGSAHPTFFKTPLLDQTQERPEMRKIWKDFAGSFKTVPIEQVVSDIVRGIERRSAHVVTPRSMGIAALTPGLLQKMTDRVAFDDKTISETAALCAPNA